MKQVNKNKIFKIISKFLSIFCWCTLTPEPYNWFFRQLCLVGCIVNKHDNVQLCCLPSNNSGSIEEQICNCEYIKLNNYCGETNEDFAQVLMTKCTCGASIHSCDFCCYSTDNNICLLPLSIANFIVSWVFIKIPMIVLSYLIGVLVFIVMVVILIPIILLSIPILLPVLFFYYMVKSDNIINDIMYA